MIVKEQRRNVSATPNFQGEAKTLIEKFRSLKGELAKKSKGKGRQK